MPHQSHVLLRAHVTQRLTWKRNKGTRRQWAPPGERLLLTPRREGSSSKDSASLDSARRRIRKSQGVHRPGTPWMGGPGRKDVLSPEAPKGSQEGDTHQRPPVITAPLVTQGATGQALRDTQRNVPGDREIRSARGEAPETGLFALFLQLSSSIKPLETKLKLLSQHKPSSSENTAWALDPVRAGVRPA